MKSTDAKKFPNRTFFVPKKSLLQKITSNFHNGFLKFKSEYPLNLNQNILTIHLKIYILQYFCDLKDY